MEDYEQSEASFRKALEINENFAPAYCNLGMCLYRNGGSIEETIQLYNKAIALQPEIALFYFNRGLAHFDNGNEELGLQDYSHALKLDNRLTEAYSFRAEIYVPKKMWKEASADLRKIIRIEEKLKSEDKNA